MASTNSPVLAAEHITAGYAEVDILLDVSIELEAGSIVCMIGPNGSGKSTLLKTISGFLRPKKGRVVFDGQDIGGLKPDAIVQKGISYVPQTKNIFPSLTIRENLEMGAFTRRDDYTNRIGEILKLFPILDRRSAKKAGLLSGGERQMLAMGRALMLDPQVLLLDEPSAGLAPKFVSTIFEKIADVNSTGVSVLLVEQNAKDALRMSQKGFVLAAGRNVMDGDAGELLANKQVASLYLGG